MRYYTADLHLGHYNIIKYCNRPYGSIAEMNDALIDNINHRVKKADALYILGDFAMGSILYAVNLRQRIKCKHVHFMVGNHDRHAKKSKFQEIWTTCNQQKVISDSGERVYLSHYAHKVWPRCHYGCIHLYGHAHGNMEPSKNSWDVGVDNNNYFPVSLQEVIQKLEKLGLYVSSVGGGRKNDCL